MRIKFIKASIAFLKTIDATYQMDSDECDRIADIYKVDKVELWKACLPIVGYDK